MARIVPCSRCERGRVVWTGDEYQCLQCGWPAPELARARGATDREPDRAA